MDYGINENYTQESEPVCPPEELATLPQEVLVEIFSKLDLPSVARIGQTSSFMYNISSDKDVWRKLLNRDFPNAGFLLRLDLPQSKKSLYQDAKKEGLGLPGRLLYEAATTPDLDLLGRCLEAGKQLVGRDRDSFQVSLESALQATARKGDKDALRLLLESGGGDITFCVDSGTTILMSAKKHLEVLQLLFDPQLSSLGRDIENFGRWRNYYLGTV